MIAISAISDLVESSKRLERQIKAQVYQPSGEKTLDVTYNLTDTAQMVGRTAQAIRDAETKGLLPEPRKHERTGKRLGYLLPEVNNMRDHFGTRLFRMRNVDDPVILSFSQFKGGSSKTTSSVHVAQFLAKAGLKVLFVDTDSQGSATKLFGLAPDLEIEYEQTLGPYLTGDQKTLAYAVRPTYWDGIKLIPASISLYGAEYALAAGMRADSPTSNARALFRLRDGLDEIAADYDVVIIDPPPALGLISINVMYAANAMLVPMPPSMLDFASTLQFFEMVQEVLEVIDNIDPTQTELQYKFIKLFVAKKKARTSDDERSTEDSIVKMARDFYGYYMMNSVLYESEEIRSATNIGKTVYELDAPIGTKKTYDRARESLDALGQEVLDLIVNSWSVRRNRKAG